MAQIEARPGQPLVDHLQEVGQGARDALAHPALRSRETLTHAAYLVGVLHDAGKYTSFFQNYLHTKRTHQGREHHAFPGALLAAWLALQRWKTDDMSRPESYLPLLAFLVIHRHHGHLRTPEELVPDLPALEYNLSAWLDNDPARPQALQRFVDQWQDMRKRVDRITTDLSQLGLDARAIQAFFETPDAVGSTLETLARLTYYLGKAQGALREADRARLTLWGQLLFSALIDADKRSAGGFPALPARPHIPGDLGERYVQHTFVHPRHALDKERNAFFHTVTEHARQVSLPLTSPLALTAPTGMGKTLAAFSAALILRERLAAIYGIPPRIIYALPFINLIEQNYGVIEEVLSWGLLDFKSNRQRYLLKHHHLAEVTYRTENENLPIIEALFFTEGWESEIIVTTFVQVFHTLLGYQNNMLRKLHNLIGAILILDELQSLRMEYWPLVRQIFDVLKNEMGLAVLQMTATRPLIFVTETQHPLELYPEPSHLFHLMHRTRMDIDLSKRSVNELADEVHRLADTYGSVLVVVNTIRTSLELYHTLKAHKIGRPVITWHRETPLRLDEEERALVYLSTNIVPLHRATRLAFLADWLAAERKAVVVSTQVVEAGVDLDFPVVVRDLAPLDAIIQAAGRCNREGRRPEGLVLVRQLENSGSAHVYGVVHITQAKNLLNGITHVSEPEYPRLVERYFQQVQNLKSQAESENIWQAYVHLRYDAANCGTVPCLSDFRIIDTLPTVPVYVALNARDEAWLRDTFTPRVLRESDWKQRQEAFIKLRRFFYEHVIQIPRFRAEKNIPPTWEESLTLRWIPAKQLGEYYDLETGFRWLPEELDLAFFG